MIEDLTHEDYLTIARMIPAAYSWNVLQSIGEKVSLAFLLHRDDAIAAVLIGTAISRGASVLEYEEMKKQRIKEVIDLRNKK